MTRPELPDKIDPHSRRFSATSDTSNIFCVKSGTDVRNRTVSPCSSGTCTHQLYDVGIESWCRMMESNHLPDHPPY